MPHKVDERASRFLDLLARQAADYFERRQAEAALQESERAHAFQSSILTALRDSVWALDAELRILYWNDAATELFGWTADEVPGRNARELFNTLVPGSTREAAVEQLMRTGDFRGEILCRAKDGRTIVCNVTSHVVRGAAGEVSRVVNTARDITERKREECALRDSEEKYRSLFERIDAGFCIVEMIFDGETPVDYRFVEVNPTFRAPHRNIEPEGALDARHRPRSRAVLVRSLRPGRADGPRAALRRDGQGPGRSTYEVNAFRVGEPEQRRVAIVFSDITQLQRDPAALRASDAHVSRTKRPSEALQ